MQPQIITPGQPASTPPAPQPAQEPSAPPQMPPTPYETPSSQPATPVIEERSPYAQSSAPENNNSEGQLSWTASEYISHEKSATWYITYALLAVALSGAIYFITRDFISLGFVVIVAVAFGIFAGRKPKVQSYHIDNGGLHVGSKLYSFGLFKSFSIVKEGPLSSIVLLPLKRLAPGMTVYFDPDDEQHIIEVLGLYLPQEERRQDAVDSFMRRIRF